MGSQTRKREVGNPMIDRSMRIISDVRASVSSGVYISHFGHRRRPCRALSVLSSCAAVPSVRRRQGHSALSGLARGAPGPGCRPRAYGVSAPARPPQVLGSDDDDDANAKAGGHRWQWARPSSTDRAPDETNQSIHPSPCSCIRRTPTPTSLLLNLLIHDPGFPNYKTF